MKTTEKRRFPAAIIPPVVLTALFYILRGNGRLMNAFTDSVSVPVRSFLSAVFSRVPFSVAELLYAAAIIWAVYYIVKIFMAAFSKKRRGWRSVLFRVLTLAAVALWIWCAYCWMWGAEYCSAGFADKSGLSDSEPSVEELYAVTLRFAEKANEYSVLVRRDADGHFDESIDSCFDASADVYKVLEEEFPFLTARYARPKKMLFSGLMSRMGYTGFYFPFTGEANVNIKEPAAFVPSTIAHEMAHQRDVSSEAEANFLAVAACVSANNVVYQYSGYLKGLVNLMNALYYADRELWSAVRETYSDAVAADIRDSAEYWASMEGGLSDALESFFDSYLKHNGQTLGISSYGACVNLLVSYYYEGE